MAKYMADESGVVWEVVGEHPNGVDVWLDRGDGHLRSRPRAGMVDYDRKPDEGEIWKNADGQQVIILGKNVDGGFYTVPRVTDGVPANGLLPVTTYRRSELSSPKKPRT
jgi:hypothetical protein